LKKKLVSNIKKFADLSPYVFENIKNGRAVLHAHYQGVHAPASAEHAREVHPQMIHA
jgi:hypothetical protein